MTMPQMMNCQHQGEGWCLKCVEELAETANAFGAQNEQMRRTMKAKLNLIKKLRRVKNSWRARAKAAEATLLRTYQATSCNGRVLSPGATDGQEESQS